MTLATSGVTRRPIARWPLAALRLFTSTSWHLARASPELLALPSLTRPEHHALARAWLDGLEAGDIPRESLEVSYARSSGPGGQHVNKTNSKAVIRCDLGKATGKWLPPFVMSPLSKSPHFIPSPPSLLISSQTSRSASSNLSSALSLLHRTIVSAGRSVLVGETSIEQREKVKRLMRAEDGRRRGFKDRRGEKKSARRGD